MTINIRLVEDDPADVALIEESFASLGTDVALQVVSGGDEALRGRLGDQAARLRNARRCDAAGAVPACAGAESGADAGAGYSLTDPVMPET